MGQLCSKLHPEADKGCTDAGARLPFAEKQFDAAAKQQTFSVLSEPSGLTLTVPQSESGVHEQIVSSSSGCEQNKKKKLETILIERR